jgi:DNA-binding SARP family transcriptional activator/tetratricopeptide (TPR) repeat protein
MEFRILGNLEAGTSSGERLLLGGPHEQKVLAVLLLTAERVVPVTRLVDALWDDGPPTTAVKQVQNAVGRLRRMLASTGEPDPIVTETAGYRIRLDRSTLDARLFEAMVARAEGAARAGDVAEAAALLGSALSLWRGPALAGLRGAVIEAAAAAWDERQCAIQESFYEHRLALGDHHEIVTDLCSLVTAHPLREQPVAQLMLALYRCGRQADALAEFRRVRTVLAEELGLDPGQELQHLHRRILAGDRELKVPAAARDQTGASRAPAWLAVPRQLPAAPRNFAGRVNELKTLTGLLDECGKPGGAGTVLISAIGGMAGVGKTALAVHWAHQMAEWFPDGQLYINLRGFDPSGTLVRPAEAVRGFLTSLNVPAERIPASLDQQAALYRSLLAGKKMLIVLDNARDSAQVRPLLPGSAGCLVLVTSRNQLTGLVAADGAHPVILDLLTETEARQVLATRLGEDRLAAEPGPTADLITLCARLPLALNIAAAQAATRPGRPLAALTAGLRDARDRLDALDADDDTSVRSAFSWSYGQLSELTARVFRLLGLHPGPDIAVPAAASLACLSRGDTRRVLAELTAAHLVDENTPGRFAFHDLLRAYAAEQARAGLTGTERHTAIRRLLDCYLHAAHAAALLLHPARDPIPLGAREPGTTPEDLANQAEALSWFDAEHRVLLAAVTQAADADFPGHAWRIAWALASFLDRRGQWDDWHSVEQTALIAARRAGDRTGQAHALTLQGRAAVRLRRYEEAREHLRDALALFRSLGDHAACARAHLDLGWMATQQGEHDNALGSILRALELYRSIGHEKGEALALTNLAWLYAVRGDYQAAISCCQEALALHRAHGNVVTRAATLDTLGYVQHHLGRYPRAIDCYQQAIACRREMGDRHNVADMLARLADAHLANGDPQAAKDAWQDALTILDDLQHPDADQIRGKLAACPPPG